MTASRLLLALGLLFASLARAETLSLTHSGYILSGADQPVSATVGMRFYLYDAVAEGTLLWTGDAAGAACQVSVMSGYYAVVLGGTGSRGCGTGLTSDAFLTGAPRYLELELDGLRLSPRQLITTAPRAAMATVSNDTRAVNGVAASALVDATSGKILATALPIGPGGVALRGEDGLLPASVLSPAAPAAHTHAAGDVNGLATVATSGLYANLTGTPATFAPSAHSHSVADVTGFNAAALGAVTGTLAAGKWCTSDGVKISCTSADPTSASGGQPNAGIASPAACSASTAGYVWYDSSVPALKVCNGASYVSVSTVAAPPGAPGAPTVSPSNGALSVSWSTVSGVSSYEVGYQVGTVIDGSATVVAVPAGTGTTLSGLTNGTAYAVAVRSVAGTWKSAWSAVALGTPSALTCSTGYIVVPQTTLPDGTVVAPFCVMQFEAKYVSGAAVSQASETPWVSITWTDARAACTSAGKHLITENEWLAIANNAANEGSNWTGVGGVGSGALYSGHNEGTPNNALSVSNASDGYNQTGNQTGSTQRRTLSLSNGAVVWDLAGNVWEWTDQTILAAARWHNAVVGWMEYPAATDLPREKRPPDLSWDWNQGMGRYYSSGPTDESAFLRGSSWGGAAVAGVFALNLVGGRAYLDTVIGFRCAGP